MTTPPDVDGQPLELLIKLMRMTQAEDNIALVAIKKANSHLQKLGTDWEALLRGKVKIIADPFASMNIPASTMNPNRNQDFKPPPPAKPQAPQRPAPDPYVAPQRPRPQPSPVRPKPGAPAFVGDTLERTIVNKFEGTCTACKNRVPVADGIAEQWKRPDGTMYWTTKHSQGYCPKARVHKPASTSSSFQV